MSTGIHIPPGTAPTSPLPGDAWYNRTTNKLYTIGKNGEAIEHVPDPARLAEIREAIRTGRPIRL